jgi:hypothetical protein
MQDSSAENENKSEDMPVPAFQPEHIQHLRQSVQQDVQRLRSIAEKARQQSLQSINEEVKKAFKEGFHNILLRQNQPDNTMAKSTPEKEPITSAEDAMQQANESEANAIAATDRGIQSVSAAIQGAKAAITTANTQTAKAMSTTSTSVEDATKNTANSINTSMEAVAAEMQKAMSAVAKSVEGESNNSTTTKT